jgi:hypothetical protein
MSEAHMNSIYHLVGHVCYKGSRTVIVRTRTPCHHGAGTGGACERQYWAACRRALEGAGTWVNDTDNSLH